MHAYALYFVGTYVAVSSYYMVGYQSRVPDPAVFQTPTMHDLVFDRFFNSRDTVAWTDDGVKLLQKNGVADKPFLVMEFASFLHFALRTKPYAGTPFIDYAVNITKDSHPSREKYIGEPPYIMQAKKSVSYITMGVLKECYGDYIAKHYKVLDESDAWVLLQRQ
jgi:hypothetical protein